MFSTSVKEFSNKQDRITIVAGSTKLLLRKMSICLLVALTVLSSFAFSEPASAAPSSISIDAASAPTFNSNGFTAQCADEQQICTFTGTKVVRYGANGGYAYKVFTHSALCDNATFGGDPADGVRKSCYYRDVRFDDGITAAVSERNKAVTVTFNVYATQADTLADLKNRITVGKTGDPAFTALDAKDTVAVFDTGTSSKLVINLDTALVGNANAIRIASGALVDQIDNPFNLGVEIKNIAAWDLSPVAYTGSSSYEGNNVTLNFNKPITINTDGTVTAAAYLKNSMSIATDGVNFVPFSKLIEVRAPGEGVSSNQISLNASNNTKVILGTNTLIKIAGGTLKNAAGEFNTEMILHVTPPVIQSATIDSTYKIVTISFQESILDHTYSNGASTLANYIHVLRNGSNDWINLTGDDKAYVESGNLVIVLATPLSGANNQIMIRGDAVKDSYGNVLRDYTITPLIQGDPAAGNALKLQLLSSYLSNGYQDVTLVFNKDVLNAKSDDVSFLAGIRYYGGSETSWGWANLPATATVAFSGKTVSIHFAVPMRSGNSYNFQFTPGLFKDTAGNIYQSSMNIPWFYPGQPLTLQNGSFSNDGRRLSLDFNKEIADLTLLNGVSQLKDQLTISTDNGNTFNHLEPQDALMIQGNKLVIFFQNAKKLGSIEVKIPANVISDLGNNVRNEEIHRVVAYNTPTITGFFLSNTASEFVFEDNAIWRSQVREITINDENQEVARPLNASEYTLSAGKLTIKQGVFEEGSTYWITIHADGYSGKAFRGRAYVSTEWFYMTAPVVTTDSGITAKVNILNNYNTDPNYTGTQAVVFKLMDGTTPVSIVASNLSIATGSYSANFNVTDAATNPNYTVQVFVVNRYNNDPEDAGLNLASIKTQNEWDQIVSDRTNQSPD